MSNTTRSKPNINNEEDHEKIKKSLVNYIHIHDRHHHLIPPFLRIRYIDRETGVFNAGGILISNKSPNSMLIRGLGYKAMWKIIPEKYTIFIEDYEYRTSVQLEKNNLYKLYCEGKLNISINGEIRDEE